MSTTPMQMSEARRFQQLKGHLSYLKLNDAAKALNRVLDQARSEGMSLTAALERLLEIEVEATEARRLAARLRFACLPEPWTLRLSGVVTKDFCKAAVQDAADASGRRLRAPPPRQPALGGNPLSCWSGASIGSRHDCRCPAHPRVVPAPPPDQHAPAGVSVAGSCLD
ncbi:ATPase AAA [Embleya hyalina]|uniref:ATPase AAA n=1 Tax=Embleya hyalina TaxID=516124 RepID=A0A401YWZ3_9ACTN|nr:ATPase AAA [Embleya hyalina]